MSGLQIMYSKEVAKELTKIAVCLPGAPVEVGQIIHFPFGRSGVWPFRKSAPQGAFNLITTLQNLGINPQETGPDEDGDPYIFASRKSVKIDANFDATGTLTPGVNANGQLNASFEAEGSVYFAAIDCKTNSISNLDQIGVDLEKHTNSLIWDETFLVTSVTIASKALIMQSSTKSAVLTVQVDIKGLVTKNVSDINANAQIGVKNFKESSFIKPWSDNVTIFIGLHRFTKENFGLQPSTIVHRLSAFESIEVAKIASGLINSPNDKYRLEPVSAFEILDEDDLKTLE